MVPEGRACYFGCHIRKGWEPNNGTVYDMAKNAGIPLREDVLKDAFGTFVDTWLSPSDPDVRANRKRMSVIGFSADSVKLQDPTSDGKLVKASLDLFDNAQRWNTNYPVAIPNARKFMTAPGPTSSRTLLIITDGMNFNWAGGPDPEGPLKQSLCDAYKAEGFRVAVIEIKYQDASGEGHFDYWVKPVYSQLSPALKACATPGLYFQASDSDNKSMAQAFAQAAVALRTKVAIRH